MTHVWVDGVARVEKGALTSIDPHELQLNATHWRDKIRSREK